MINKILPEDSEKRRLSYVLIIIGLSLVLITSLFGLKDNTAMILLCFVGVVATFIAFVHHWDGKKNYQILLIFSLVGLMFFIFLHNLSYVYMVRLEDNFVLHSILNVLYQVTFLISVFLLPAGILIGVSGLLYLFVKKRISKKSEKKSEVIIENKEENAE